MRAFVRPVVLKPGVAVCKLHADGRVESVTKEDLARVQEQLGAACRATATEKEALLMDAEKQATIYVAREHDSQRELLDLLVFARTIIANVDGGDLSKQSRGWQVAAAAFRNGWAEMMARHRITHSPADGDPTEEYVPLAPKEPQTITAEDVGLLEDLGVLDAPVVVERKDN